MVATRALRSTRSLDAESAASSANDRALQKDAPSPKTKAESVEKRHGAPHVKPRSPSSKRTSKPRRSSSPRENEGDDDAVADENDDDEDNVDVKAPPRGSDEPVTSIDNLDTPAESLAGLPKPDTIAKAMSIHGDAHPSNEDNDVKNDEDDAAEAIPPGEFSDDGFDSDVSNFEVADDDDDYDAVDNISIASDDSRQFEADVEREIQAAGEAGIDWDDENTYHYENTLNDDIYGFAHESGMSQSLLGLDLFHFDHNLDTRLTQSTPNLPDLGEQIAKFDQAISENMLKLDRSVASNSDDSSVTAEEDAKPVEKSKPALKMDTSFENDGDTTDEDISWTTVSSPGVTLSCENNKLDRKTPKTKKAQRMPRKHRLSMRKIPPHPEKAIAYSVTAPFGSTVRFCTPKTKAYRWMDLRGRGSRQSSRPSSPTMINLEDAYTRGNTRTGAHITDVINGTLFSALHCRGESISELLKKDEPSVSKFYQPLLKDDEDKPSKLPAERAGKPLEDSALALIDFTGGAQEEELSSSDESMEDDSEQAGTDIQKAPRINVADCTFDGEDSPMNLTPSIPNASHASLRTPMTPPPELDLLMGDDQSSPKKRRLSNRSNGRRSVSPAIKKQRYDGSSEVVV